MGLKFSDLHRRQHKWQHLSALWFLMNAANTMDGRSSAHLVQYSFAALARDTTGRGLCKATEQALNILLTELRNF